LEENKQTNEKTVLSGSSQENVHGVNGPSAPSLRPGPSCESSCLQIAQNCLSWNQVLQTLLLFFFFLPTRTYYF